MAGFTLPMNPRHGTPGVVTPPASGFRRAKAEIVGWEGYAPTPLVDLPFPGTVRMKDESGRFGLGGFKALGDPYAVANALAGILSRCGIAPSARSSDLAAGIFAEATRKITVTAATGGNHGRAVAWAASRFHCQCAIYVHETVSAHRQAAIAAYGARVRRVPGTYDDAVRACARDAAAQDRVVVSDTSWPEYTEVPRDITQGYRLMTDEAADQWTGAPPTHVFIQAGVGSAAAAVAVQIRVCWPDRTPRLIVAEPDRAACLMASAQAGRIAAAEGNLDTVMAVLACGVPGLLAWTELERAASVFMAIPDRAAVEAMQLLDGIGVVIGESGGAGLAALGLASRETGSRELLGLDEDSRVLVFGTEGPADMDLYASLVKNDAY
jgi:diaminopropionate ammonia-lyase